ncbi:MAG: hypothetical protein JW866_01000 [Ignavibacteriales bacterium]|nr:hypothetical protein [Ignavibacteriales bacterium]
MKIFIKSLISTIIFISIHLFLSCSDNENGEILVEIFTSDKQIKLCNLFEKYDTNILIDSIESFSNYNHHEILTKTVIIDTTIKDVYNIDGQTYIKACIVNKLSDRILTVLKCDEDTAKIVDNIKSNRVLISAKISNVKFSDSVVAVQDIDGETKYLKLGYDIFLFGNLLEINELPLLNSYNKNYWN